MLLLPKSLGSNLFHDGMVLFILILQLLMVLVDLSESLEEGATSKATINLLCMTAAGCCFSCQQNIGSRSLWKDRGDRKMAHDKLDAEL